MKPSMNIFAFTIACVLAKPLAAQGNVRAPSGAEVARASIVPRAALVPPSDVNDRSSYAKAMDALCGARQVTDKGRLLTEELRRVETVRKHPDSSVALHALACTRVQLDEAGAVGREGYMMPLGTGWQEGATMAWLAMLEHDTNSRVAVEALGVLSIEQPFPRRVAAVRKALTASVASGVRSSAAVRGCAVLTLRVGDRAASRGCAEEGLRQGEDSTWQLLHLSRLAAHDADTSGVSVFLERALRAAHDSSAWAEVGWQLRWFTEPSEWTEWLGLGDGVRQEWVRDRLASRDVRDGRRQGSRLVEHWNRLDHVEANFRREVPRHLRGFSQLTANVEGGKEPDRVRFTASPEFISAQPYRFFLPFIESVDDRGAVWLRFGAPTKRADWMAVGSTSPLVRESWLYELDGEPLLLHFESEAFDGAWQATRLVPGVLGLYLCGLDRNRCTLTMSLSCWEFPDGCMSPPISVERLEAERAEDRSDIEIATTRDDNSVRVAHAIATVAQFSRVWDPRSGATLGVIPYAFKVGDVERTEDSTGTSATIALTLRQWDAGAASWQSTDVIRRLRLPDRLRNSSHLTGYLVTPTTPGTSAWSLVATQGTERRGRAWGDRMIPLTPGELTMSDLVIGAESQGQTWTSTGGTEVPLGPLGAFAKDLSVSLYWQVRSSTARESVRIAIALFRVGPRDTERPVLEVAFDGRLAAGLNELQRNLGVAELDGGTYRVEVTVRDGAQVSVRSGRLLLQ